MTRSDTLRDELAQLERKKAALQKDLGKHQTIATKEREAAARKRNDAARTKSDSTRRMNERSTEQHERKLAAAEVEIGKITGRLADNAKARATKQRSLGSATASEQRSADERDRRRRREEVAHARAVSRAQIPTVSYVRVDPPELEKLRVLYLMANPEADDVTTVDPDGTITTVSRYLRLQHEVREVQRSLRGAKYRDLVAPLELRPAATVEDLVDAMNDVRPHLVHFSGHGSSEGVVLDDGDLENPGSLPVDFDLLARVLAATDSPPRVLVLNACQTLAGAEILLPAVPVVVAMADSIDDTAAIGFARRFYAAIASAQSVRVALDQATLVMEATALGDADLPQLRVRDDISVDELVLVRPPGAQAARERSTVLLQDHGLTPLSVRNLEHVQSLEPDSGFAGVLSTKTAADTLGVDSSTVRTETQRLMEGGYLAADHVETDLVGTVDLIAPRLTVEGVAVLAR